MIVSEADVAPPMLTVVLRHWSVGVGEPLNEAVNVAEVEGQRVMEPGEEVTPGAELTVSVAAEVVALPQELVATQSYEPASPAAAAGIE